MREAIRLSQFLCCLISSSVAFAQESGKPTVVVSVQVSVGCGQMRTEGKGAQDISRSVIVK
jgi:hypothetical protein